MTLMMMQITVGSGVLALPNTAIPAGLILFDIFLLISAIVVYYSLKGIM